MQENVDYIIDCAQRTSCKYGEVIVLELEDNILYLPRRFNSLEDVALVTISTGRFSISKVHLKDSEGSYLYRLEIKEALPTNAFYPY